MAAPTPLLADLLRRESVNLAWGATVALITGRESDKLLDTLAYLRRAGFAVSLILIQPAGVSAAFDRRAAMLNVPVHRVWRKGDCEMGRGLSRKDLAGEPAGVRLVTLSLVGAAAPGEERRLAIRDALRTLLNVAPEQVELVPGPAGPAVELEMDTAAANRLRTLLHTGSPKLALLKIEKVVLDRGEASWSTGGRRRGALACWKRSTPRPRAARGRSSFSSLRRWSWR